MLLLLPLGLVLWLAAVCVAIAHEPPEGSPSATALSTDVTRAVRNQDADRLQRLFAPDTVGDDYATTLLARLTGAGPTSPPATVRTADGGQFLHLGTTAADGRPTCLTWQITQTDDRWYADGIPPLAPPACP
ncbi:hypothetical protein ACIP93_30120 [Streptomyces sp. NPDC088745]|uniref:hypothetical protein n=1 Tax=Streptomyces sp. NPDC088745 TaxID=3365884 RepID=UPI0037FB5BBD